MMKDIEYHRHADRFRGAECVGDCVAALVVLDYEPGFDPGVEPFAILDEAAETFRFVSVDAAQVDDDFMAVIDSKRIENRSMVLELLDAICNHFTTG
jgi:hypothetical protein